jgi:hypothetical protein
LPTLVFLTQIEVLRPLNGGLVLAVFVVDNSEEYGKFNNGSKEAGNNRMRLILWGELKVLYLQKDDKSQRDLHVRRST